jgi:NAD(P)-dependent dehydrogenase (short-subunit alcohol dehydrogenase family)
MQIENERPAWTRLLQGKVAVVTGAASGIGKASAVLCAQHGAKVVIADVNEAGAEVAKEIAESGGEAMFVRTDVSSDHDARELAAKTLDRFGAIDVLMNNAAATALCNQSDRAVHELPEAVWDQMLDITLKGAYLCSKHCVPAMLRNGRGAIVNVTSCDAFLPEAGFASYTAAKGGVIALTKAMAVDYGKRGIRVNCVSPGYVITEVQMGWFTNNPDAVREVERNHLTPRLGKPEDVANMAMFLASGLAEFVTGAIVAVDGGYQIYKPSSASDFCREPMP